MTTRAKLDGMAALISKRLDHPHYIESWHGQGKRLVREFGPGSDDVSPILPAGELERWMVAYLAGMDAARDVQGLKDRVASLA